MKILGISGKKQSGKNTSVNFLFGLELSSGLWDYKGKVIEIESFEINKEGKLVVPVEVNGKTVQQVLDLDNPNDFLREFLVTNIWPFLKCYSFADKVKHVAIDIFGLTYEQCYGTDADKNTDTKYKWEDMPESLIARFWGLGSACLLPKENRRNITAREMLQLLGTEVFRWIHNDIWVDACIRQIQKEQPDLAVIPDVRFPNEVEGIKKAGGKVIRLTRSHSNDTHGSETALDKYKDWDAVIDNNNMDIPTQNAVFISILKHWDYLPYPASSQILDIIGVEEKKLNDCFCVQK